MAGFMRVLTAEFMDRFSCKVLNIHPSLLPAFPGAHAVADAIDKGVKVTGVTIHFADELVDHGPIVAQTAVAVRPDDSVDTLHARIQAEEHRLLPEVVAAFVEGRLVVENGKVIWL